MGILSLLLLGACSSHKQPVTADYNVIPQPQQVKIDSMAAPFVLRSSTVISYPEGNRKMERTAHFLAGYLHEVCGIEPKVSTRPSRCSIILEVDPRIPHPEGYELEVTAKGVKIRGGSEAGVFYGIQTLYKSLPITSGKVVAALPAGRVSDYPRFGYRGFLVDVGRHFFSVAYLKEVIDMLALHNINHFHWHLTEDQGWRIEIKKYPKLTQIGSHRKETIVKAGTDEYDGVPVSGYYTQEEAREIVRYAAERFITVIPEVDMPGHMMAALASYPELGCTGGPYEVPTQFGVFKEVLCAGNAHTLAFAKDVLEEIMDIFPSEYIHIGGDECPKERWKSCPKCQKKIRELGLEDTPEHTKENRLQAHFMGEVEKVINARGRKMMGWDEILEGKPAKSATVMAWTSVNAGAKSARLQHKTIICPISHLYFSNPGYNRLRGIASVQRVYDFEPMPAGLSEQEKANVIGAQGCIWTEWTKDSVKMEWQMMPRIAALAELQWSDPSKKDLKGFLKRLRHQLDIYHLRGYHYKEDIEEVNIHILPRAEGGKADVELSTFDQAPIYYTLDGSDPKSHGIRYEHPFELHKSAEIKAVSVRNGKASEVATEVIDYNLATMRPIVLNSKPEERFTYKGASLLVDGLLGDGNYRSGQYLGFYGKDLDVTVDLQESQRVSSIFVSTCLVPGDYIFGLIGLEVYASEDGEKFRKIAEKKIPILSQGAANNITRREEMSFPPLTTRYIRIVGKTINALPQWHPGKGKKAFIFVDEIGCR